MFDKENKTLKNSASADQIAGNHSIINLSQDSKVLTWLYDPKNSILLIKYASWRPQSIQWQYIWPRSKHGIPGRWYAKEPSIQNLSF